MRKKIRVHLKGGLGNQLFQYYAGLHLSTLKNLPLELEMSALEHGRNPHDSRIDSLNVSCELLYTKRRHSLSLFGWTIRNWLQELNSNLVFAILKPIDKLIGVYVSSDTGFDLKLSRLRSEWLVDGYFQTWRYFQEVKEKNPELVLDLEPKDTSAYLMTMMEKVENKKILAIHVRRGDYSSAKGTFGLLAAAYYEQGIRQLRLSGITWDQAWVFTDDIRSTRQELRDLIDKEGLSLIETPRNSPSVESLFLMSQASSMIVANSTFSWWAATLGREKDGVVCPAKWFRNLSDPEDLYPLNWIRVKSSWVD
jgi:hypothetical protein